MTFPFDKPGWNKQAPQCILTGIRVRRGDLWTRADLHIVGDTFIINCPTDNFGDAFWQYTDDPAKQLFGFPAIDITLSDIFERRGVIIVHRSQARLSPEAITYMKARQ